MAEENCCDRHEELEARIERLEQIIGLSGKDPDEAALTDVMIAGNPIGEIVNNNRQLRDQADTENDTQPKYDYPFPIYRMAVAVRNGNAKELSANDRRAATLFQRFVRKAKGEPSIGVSLDGRIYSIDTEQATEILLEENMLDGVSEQSRSQVVARAMREVQRYSIVEWDDHQECDSIDFCDDHGVVQFHSGKPHRLTVEKNRIKGVVRNTELSDKNVRTADDGESVQNSPEEGSVDEEFDRLSSAEIVSQT